MNPVHAAMMPMIAEIEEELALLEGLPSAPSLVCEGAAEDLEAAKAAVAACANDDRSVSAAELVKRRREAADRLEVAEIEHNRMLQAAAAGASEIEARLTKRGRELEDLVTAEATRRKKIVFDALREILGTGAGRLPSLIENAAPWVSNLTGLQLHLRNMTGGPQQQIATIRQALAALGDAGPAILSK